MVKSTGSPSARKAANDRPPKPYDDFPLYTHPLGYWSKKINGKIHHFGRWGRVVNGVVTKDKEDGDWATALKLFQAQREELYQGRVPRVKIVNGVEKRTDQGMTVKELCNDFLTWKYKKLAKGRITARTFTELKEACEWMAELFGTDRPLDDLHPGDFTKLRNDFPATWGPVREGNVIGRFKSVFAYAFEQGYIPTPMQFGVQFKRPDKDVCDNAKRGKKLFDADELRKLIEAADPVAKAMVLLGINCAYGNHDCALMPLNSNDETDEKKRIVVDLENGWLQFPRTKTYVPRRAWLRPETRAALKAVLAERPEPRAKAAALFFVTRLGRPYLSVSTTTKLDSGETVVAESAHPVTRVFGELLKKCGIKRAGLGHYALRHTFRTIADEVLDRNAIDLVMGHKNNTMAGNYIQKIGDSRLQAVAEHVRRWLFPVATEAKTEGGAA